MEKSVWKLQLFLLLTPNDHFHTFNNQETIISTSTLLSYIEYFMTDYQINQLHFSSNAKHILALLRAKSTGEQSPTQFSLNSIKLMPESLNLPLTQPIMTLSLLNITMPSFDEKTKQIALDNVLSGQGCKESESTIQNKIEKIRELLKQGESENRLEKESLKDLSILDVFEQAVSNYTQHQFFSKFDWCFTNWGTIQDIHSVVESTFERPTSYIEFKTAWTPPIPAMQALANTFPSIKFELKYHCNPDDPWTSVEIFPFPPFSY